LNLTACLLYLGGDISQDPLIHCTLVSLRGISSAQYPSEIAGVWPYPAVYNPDGGAPRKQIIKMV
jgi:hypothetical protein